MKRRFLALVAAVMMSLALLAGTASAAGQSSDPVVRARNGVARVLSLITVELYDGSGSYVGELDYGYSTGSSFGVGTAGQETDVFVTNRHVIEMPEDDEIEFSGNTYYGKFKSGGYYILLDDFAYNINTFTLDTSRAIPCTVIYLGASEDADVAVLRTAEKVPGRVALPLLGSEDTLEVADRVSSLGYPGSSDAATSEGYLLASVDDVTVNSGEVSRLFDSASVTADSSGALTGHLIHHNAAINGGNSGGPLMKEGAVAGINTYTYHGGNQSVTNSYYALRIRYAKEALDSLGIHYDVLTPGGSSNLIMWVVIGVVAAAAVIALVVVIVKHWKPVPPPPPPPGAQYRIQAESGVFAGRRFAVSGQVRIGVDPAQNDLVYPQTPGISRVHCVVLEQNGALFLKDLGSSYGTFLAGGQRLAANQAVQVKIGDRFYLGSEKEMFRVTGKGGV